MKFHYRLPVKLLALFLLLIFLTGGGIGLYGTICCADAGAFNSADFWDSYLAYRSSRSYIHNVQTSLELFASDDRWTIASQNLLEELRTRFYCENTNLRIMLESPDADGLLALNHLLRLPDETNADRTEKLLTSETFFLPVSGGTLGDWVNAKERLSARQEEASRLREQDAEAWQRWQSEANERAPAPYRGNTSADYAVSDAADSDASVWETEDEREPYYNERLGSWFTSKAVSDEVDALELEESVPCEITAYLYADTALPIHDEIRSAYYRFQDLKSYAYPSLALLAVCALLALADWLYLMCAAGHRPHTDKDVITLRFVDRIPYDLFIAVCGLAFAPPVAFLFELRWIDQRWVDQTASQGLLLIGLSVIFFGLALVSVIFTLSTAARWKSRTLLRNTILWRVCAAVWRTLSGGAGKVAERFQPRPLSPQEQAQKQQQRAQKQEQRNQTMNLVGKNARSVFGVIGGWFAGAWRKLCGAFEAVPLVWKGLVLLLAIDFLNVFLFLGLLESHGGLFWALLLFGFNLAVLWGYLNLLREMVWLNSGAKKIAAGDLDYRIPSDVMHWEFRAHAEALNAIRDGIDAAVEDRVRAVKERTKSERMRTELLTNVSHDIKTPLTSIINYVDLLKKENVEGAQAREYIEVLDRQSIRLKKLLEDLLEASKASTGNITVNAAPTSVGELLRQVTGEYAEKLAAAQLEPIITLPAQEARIFADGRLLWRVFDNLMANIVKYAMPHTRVYFDLRSDPSVTVVAVKNVSRDRLNIAADELMERFVRGDASRSTEGSGLGLSIAQSLTELMGGAFELMIDGDLFKVQLRFPTLRETPNPANNETDGSPSVQPAGVSPAAAPAPEAPSAEEASRAETETPADADSLSDASELELTGGARTLAERHPFLRKGLTLRMAMMAKAAVEAENASVPDSSDEPMNAAETPPDAPSETGETPQLPVKAPTEADEAATSEAEPDNAPSEAAAAPQLPAEAAEAPQLPAEAADANASKAEPAEEPSEAAEAPQLPAEAVEANAPDAEPAEEPSEAAEAPQLPAEAAEANVSDAETSDAPSEAAEAPQLPAEAPTEAAETEPAGAPSEAADSSAI